MKHALLAAALIAAAALGAGQALAQEAQTVTCTNTTAWSPGTFVIRVRELDATVGTAIVGGVMPDQGKTPFGDFQVPYRNGVMEFTIYFLDGRPRGTLKVAVLTDRLKGDATVWWNTSGTRYNIDWPCDMATAYAGKPRNRQAGLQ